MSETTGGRCPVHPDNGVPCPECGAPPAPDAGVEEARARLANGRRIADSTVAEAIAEYDRLRQKLSAARGEASFHSERTDYLEQRLRAVEAERDELKEANTSLIHDIRTLQEAASPPAPDPALHEFALDLDKGVAHWGEDCPKFDGAILTSTSDGLPIKGFMLCECVVDALRTPAPTPDETGD